MDFNNRHPLDAITGNSSISMLEALIPFVDYPLKLPLALFIKMNEILYITRIFRSRETLDRMGLHHPAKDPVDLAASLTGIPPDLLKTVLASQQTGDPGMMDFFSSLSGNPAQTDDTVRTDGNPVQNGGPTVADDTDDFEAHIQRILRDYDAANTINRKEKPT